MTKKQINLFAKLYLSFKIGQMREENGFHEVFGLRLEGMDGGITVEVEEDIYDDLDAIAEELAGKHIRFNTVEEIYKYVINE